MALIALFAPVARSTSRSTVAAAMPERGEDMAAEGVWAELGIADDRIGHRGEVYDR